MMDVIIFGIQDFAELAHFYLSQEEKYNIVAFTVHREYLRSERFNGLPVVPFEDVEKLYPPDRVQMFAPMSPSKINTLRENVFNQARAKGYRFISYISPKATYYGTKVGENCFIFENNVIQPFTEIGDNVILWSGNHIGHHSRIHDHVFVTSHAVISGHVVIHNNCFLGVNSTIVDGIELAPYTYVGAGAMIGASTEKFGVYPGTKSEMSKVPSNRLKMN